MSAPVNRFVVIDLEATSKEPAEAHICEWAAVVMEPEWFGQGGVLEPVGGLVRPPVTIPPETSAVHHIVDADVIEAPVWQIEAARLALLLAPTGTVAVAHNAAYEREVLNKTALPNVQWLCTYKAALRVWPDAPGHGNEALRYWLGLPGIGRRSGQAPHSAGHDAKVTAQILAQLLVVAKLEDMLQWTGEPALLPRCPIGVWRNHPWPEVEFGFLEWIIYKARDMREDIIFCARKEVERRHAVENEARAARLRPEEPVAAVAGDIDDPDIPF